MPVPDDRTAPVDSRRSEFHVWLQPSGVEQARLSAHPDQSAVDVVRLEGGRRAHQIPATRVAADHFGALVAERRQRRGLTRAPKGKSKRTIPLPPELVPLLEKHRDVQQIERMVAGKRWNEHDLVFSRPDGTPIHPRDDWDDWKALLADAGVRDVRIHDARHTAGTLLIAMGVHVRTVQEILGHADIRTTQRYTHVASPMAKDAAKQMGQALWGTSE